MGLTLVITGAGGFIGRATVAAALRHGHTVRALVRRDDILFPPEVELHVVDLARDAPQIAHALHGADAVIHAAAAMSGDAAITARDTLAWWSELPQERREKPRAGLPADREAEVLAAWKKAQKKGWKPGKKQAKDKGDAKGDAKSGKKKAA